MSFENAPIDINFGLNSEEIKERKERNQINIFIGSPNKTLKEIVIKNIFTLFNFINLFLAILIIISGSYINLTFMGIILTNTSIGIFQEWRAKIKIEKLSLLKESRVFVLRNGEFSEISKNELLKDDILILKKGMQSPVDAILVDNKTIDIDESQITGESDFVTKKCGDLIYSGSLIMQGEGKAQVFRFGKDTYINQLTEEAKKYKMLPSELHNSIRKIVRIVTFSIIPTGIMLFATQLFFVENQTWQQALVGSVAGIIGMIPEGLILLTSVAMALGVIRLAMIKTLTQDMYAIETLARADVLCLDKTGTLTEGKLIVTKVVYFSSDEEYLSKILNAIAKNDTEQNASTEALREYFKDEFNIEIKNQIPFSSQRKWQGIEFTEYGTWILGAPDLIIKEDHILKKSNEYSNQGFRVLAVLNSKTSLKDESIPEDSKTQMLIILEDRIRPEASEILNYFKKQKVSIKIISGDNPLTVKNLAKQAGLYSKAIDANILPEDIDSLKIITEKIDIFGRVKPEQKSLLVEAMQKNGHIVAMTGDGINDILALKKSDCGIAMASGSDATQAVAQFVLLDSKFTSLPEVIRQGRRVINNISRVACLFLVKTFYSLLLSILMILGSLAYPYEPIQISLVSLFAVGIPSFLLALEPNDDKVKENFFKRVLAMSLPSSIIIAFMIFLMAIINDRYLEPLNLHYSRSEISTFVIIYIGCIQIWTLYTICRPLNKWRGTIVIGVFILFISSFFLKSLRRVFKFVVPSLDLLLMVLIFILISMLLIWSIRKYVSEAILNDKKNVLSICLNYFKNLRNIF